MFLSNVLRFPMMIQARDIWIKHNLVDIVISYLPQQIGYIIQEVGVSIKQL